MSKSVFITGTGTDIGKTYVTGLIVKRLREAGIDAGYFKAAVSGNDRIDGKLIPGDAEVVAKMAGIRDELGDMVPYIYENAVSPHLAAKIEGNPVKMDKVKSYYNKICKMHTFVTVEGSGGIMCPLSNDNGLLMLEDMVKELGLDSIIVANAGLGTINDVALTVFYMEQNNMPVKGIIFNHFHPDNQMEEDNIKMVEKLTGVPVIACVKDGDTQINIDVEVLKGMYKSNGIISSEKN